MFSSFFKSSSGTAGGTNSSSGSTSNFEIGPEINPGNASKHLFRIHEGKVKGGSLLSSTEPIPVTVFICDSAAEISRAASAVKRLKTLRHPSIVTFVDAAESDQKVTLVTEKVTPLSLHLEELDEKGVRGTARDQYIAWGIYQIMRGLSFLTNDAKLRHNSLHGDAIFVTKSGDWKLFCLEKVNSTTEGPDSLPAAHLQSLMKYDPPEVMDHMKRRGSTPWSRDMWGLGCIIWEVFNGPLPAAKNLGQIGQIPKKLSNLYMELVAANPAKRPNPKEKIEVLRRSGGYFKNELIDVLVFLEELHIKDDSEKSRFYASLPSVVDNFAVHVATYKVLPELLKAYEFGNAGAAILDPVFKLGANLESEEYVKLIVPILIKLFASNDRNARFKLLNQIENFVQHLSDKIVNEDIFPQIQNGFLDQEPMIREKSVIAMIHLAPKLTYTNLDETVVMKHFARLLRDEQAGIRTNTTVCLGKIARFLHYGTRQKVLVGAFTGKLRDPFPPARIAAINALAATQQFFTIQETSQKVLPALCPSLTDAEEPVRSQAFKVTQGFIAKLEQVSKNPELREEMEADVTSNTNLKSSQNSSSVAGWASWAVGAIGAKFYKSNVSKPPSEQQQQPTPVTPKTTEGVSRSSDNNSIRDKLSVDRLSVGTDNIEITDEDEVNNDGDGWDDDDGEGWGSLESESKVEQQQKQQKQPTSGRKPMQLKSEKKKDEYFDDWIEEPVKKPTATTTKTQKTIVKKSTGDDPWLSFDDVDDVAQKKEEEKRIREEKRLARKAEMEARKQARKAGPMKLGAKKD